MAAYARWQGFITDPSGWVRPGAKVEVRLQEGGALAALFEDRAGAVPQGNHFFADPQGYAAFHAEGGTYRITASQAGTQWEFTWVALGTAGEIDVEQIALRSGTEFDGSVVLAADPAADMEAATKRYVDTKQSTRRIVEFVDANRTLVLADAGKVLELDADVTSLTVPPAVFTRGDQIEVISAGGATTNFVSGAGVTIVSRDSQLGLGPFGGATLICINPTRFFLGGALG
jgi:hypothetical protein